MERPTFPGNASSRMPPPLPARPSSSAPLTFSSAASSSAAFLHRLHQHVHDRATPLGAFLAGLPQAPTRRAKTSSERGRAFRERQQRREEELARVVAQLRREIARLDMHHMAWQTHCLSRRSSPTGSLVQLTREYHRLFVHGLDSELMSEFGQHEAMDERRYRNVLVQERFLRRSIDETAIVGNMVGPEASIVQWRRYTQSHEGFTLNVTGIEISESQGEEDDDERVVSVVVHCVVRGRLSLNTFKMLFPHVAKDRELLDRLVGLDVSYPASRRFQFTRDGRIAVETVDVDFVAGLSSAGVPLVDVATLLQGSALTRDSMIVEVHQSPAYEKRAPSGSSHHASGRHREASVPYSNDTLAS